MSETLSRIDEYLARQTQLMLESATGRLDAGIVKMIVDALPEYSFGEQFRLRLKEMLADKLKTDQIDRIAQALVTQLPASAETILKNLSV